MRLGSGLIVLFCSFFLSEASLFVIFHSVIDGTSCASAWGTMVHEISMLGASPCAAFMALSDHVKFGDRIPGLQHRIGGVARNSQGWPMHRFDPAGLAPDKP